MIVKNCKRPANHESHLARQRLCAISYKACWQDPSGNWMSSGGFPLQMEAISSLFDDLTLVISQTAPRTGGLPLPIHAQIVPLRPPTGAGARRKLSVLMNLPYYVRNIARHVRHVDAVHTPLPGDIPLLGMMIALTLRKRLIARYGSSWFSNSETTFMERVTRTFMRAFAGRNCVMLATGEGESPPARAMNWIFATALSRSELDQIHPQLERGIANPPQLIYVGRLSPEKGVVNLVSAVALLKRDGFKPLPQVTLAGDGPERCFLERRVKDMNVEGLISFAGQLDRRDLSTHLSQADLCVQPSLTEGFSKAWLDAMSHGLPVLASQVGAATTVIGANGTRGWLVQPGDPSALAATLRHALTEPIEWPDLRRRCRDYVEERTLEAWSHEIGRLCAQKWNMSFVEGKLVHD